MNSNVIYRTINQTNNKYYIGMHRTDNLNDGYLGSGYLLRKAVKKHGKENFSKEILFIFDTAEEMEAKERELVNEAVTNDPMSYNLALGGRGGNLKRKSAEHTENIRKSVIQLHQDRPDDEKSKIKTKKMNTWQNKTKKERQEHAAKISAANTGQKRAKFSDETKRKMSESKKKVKWYTNGNEVKRCIPGTEPVGFILGRKL